jgi:hypothetical protein
MPISVQELIDKAVFQAKLDPSLASANLEPTANSLLAQVFQQVGIDCAKDERKRSLLRREKTLTFANGIATVSADVLTKYKEDALLYDPDDTTAEYSLCREWFDFVRSDDRLIGRYSFNGDTIGILEAGEVYDPADGTDGDRTLVIPCVPEVPALATDEIDVVEEVASDLVSALAESLKGAIVREAVAAT